MGLVFKINDFKVPLQVLKLKKLKLKMKYNVNKLLTLTSYPAAILLAGIATI